MSARETARELVETWGCSRGATFVTLIDMVTALLTAERDAATARERAAEERGRVAGLREAAAIADVCAELAVETAADALPEERGYFHEREDAARTIAKRIRTATASAAGKETE